MREVLVLRKNKIKQNKTLLWLHAVIEMPLRMFHRCFKSFISHKHMGSILPSLCVISIDTNGNFACISLYFGLKQTENHHCWDEKQSNQRKNWFPKTQILESLVIRNSSHGELICNDFNTINYHKSEYDFYRYYIFRAWYLPENDKLHFPSVVQKELNIL